jgi:2-amino-4-hydroxy-6-hydroxymethyldihydropteridine diphosphokinase
MNLSFESFISLLSFAIGLKFLLGREFRMQKTNVYLALGGNEGQVLFRLKQALKILAVQKEVTHLRSSHFYRTAPHEVNSPLWFVNAVCSFQTDLHPADLFNITQLIESQLGKVAKPKNAPRPIDIDLLFYGDQTYQLDGLKIPHPRWKERLFVLAPLADLTEEIILQGLKGPEHYILQNLIDSLAVQSFQEIYLLEKNPDLQ